MKTSKFTVEQITGALRQVAPDWARRWTTEESGSNGLPRGEVYEHPPYQR
jgi:hypothetical protein